MGDEIKAGARNSSADIAKLQQIQSIISDLLGEGQAEVDDDLSEGEPAEKSTGGTMVQIGESFKAIETVDGFTKVRAALVRFTPKGDYDLTGDRFAATTDFDFEFPGKSTTYFNHGMNKVMKKRRLTSVVLSKDDVAVWMDGLLDERDQYEAGLAELARAGKLGASSGVPAHLVERENEGKGDLITYWPLGKDASYTHTPAESRNVVLTLKSLFTVQPVQNQSKSIEVTMTEEELKAQNDLVIKTATDAATKAIDEFKKSLPASVKAGAAEPAQARNPNEKPYKSIGEQLLDIKAAQQGRGWSKRLEAVRDEFKAVSGMNEFVSSEGGFALQSDFSTALLDKVYAPPGVGTLLADVTRQPVSGSGFRAVVVDETSRASSRRGGFIGYWLGEGVAPSITKGALRRVGTDLEKVGAMTVLTDELISDVPALSSWVMREGPAELRFQVEDKVFNGTGAGVPLGILNANALVTVAKEAGQAAGTIVTENVVKMWSRMPMYLMAGAKWYINQEILPQLLTLSIAVGVGGVPVYLPPTGLSGAPFGSLFGRPVQPNEYCAPLSSVGDIVLANMGEYFVIDNGGIKSASSIHVYFSTDETVLRFIYRVNGFPFWNAPMTPYKGSATLSPFIALAAR
jgi:HK97 family phage major capsid protein